MPKRTGNLRPQDLHLGDAVKVLSMNLKGTVSTRPDSKGNLFRPDGYHADQSAYLRPCADRRGCHHRPVHLPHKQRKIEAFKAATISTEINLLGKTVDEAVAELDKYLDDAYLPICRVSALSTEKERAHCGKGIHNICAARNT